MKFLHNLNDYLKNRFLTRYHEKYPVVFSLFCMMMFLLFSFEANAQTEKVSLKFKNVAVEKVLNAIESQTSYRFLYNKSEVDVTRKVSLSVKNQPLSRVLSDLFRGSEVSYKIVGGQIVLNRKIHQEEPKGLPPANSSEHRKVTGIVTDEKGEPIVGATVMEKGTSNGTVTDINGNFSLNAKKGDILTFSYLGYKTKERVLTSQIPMNVELNENSKQLDEVIVIGYGTTTRKSAIGAVDQVRTDAIENRPVANITQALEGASPSLNIQTRSMDPNNNTMNINIRGISTMNSNSPLVVIDGLVSDESSLNNLNPADIASVSVLKDAGTAAIYGSRSANGVILVATKTGKKNQKPMVSVNTQVGWENPKILFSPVQGWQNATLKNLALTNVGLPPEYTPAQIQDLYNHRNEESWNYNQIIKTALQQTYNVSVSGGSNNSTYLFSGGYYDQGSNFVGPNYGVSRYNLRSNLSTEYGILKFTSIVAYTRNMQKSTTSGNAIINTSRIPPYYYYKMRASNGKYLVNDAVTDENSLAELLDGGWNKYDNDNVNINLNLDIKIIDGLKLRGIFGSDMYFNHRFTRDMEIPLYASEDATEPLVYDNPTRQTQDWNNKSYLLNYQLLLDYNKTYGRNNVYGLLGATNESFTSQSNELDYKYTDPILGTPTTGSQIDPSSYNTVNSTTKTSITSLFGRVGWNYNDRYYSEFSFRYDGSSKFAKKNRWGFFPSISLGWRISSEDFMKYYRDHIGDLKLRATYGVLGNQDIDPYQYLTVYSSGTNVYGFNNASVSGAGFTYGNTDLKWETTHTYNLGIDAAFLNNSLVATFDYFLKKTSDILITPEIPSAFGTTLSKTNAGAMQDQGWEFNLSYRFKTGQFAHSLSVNLSDNWNKVTKFEGGEQISTIDDISRIIRVGLPFNAYYGYKVAGYFKSVEDIETSSLPVGINASDLRPGDVKFVDRNHDGVIDAKDRYVLGTAFPRYNFGFIYNVSYKNFDFSAFIQGVGKRDMMVRGELVEPFHENYSYVIYRHQLDFWTPTNPDARWPRLVATGSTSDENNYRNSSNLYLLDGKYMRLKNISLGYTLPSAWINKLGIQKFRIYVNAQNLLTLSRNSWIDPESSEFDSNMSGASNSARNYPSLRYYGFGLDIVF